MDDVEDVRCGDCKFFASARPQGRDIGGECRRYPPQPLVLGNKIKNRWPLVFDHQGCGEFQPLPDE